MNNTFNFNKSILGFAATVQTFYEHTGYVTLQAFLSSIPYVCPLLMMGEVEGGT
jgi:hypothetical protein